MRIGYYISFDIDFTPFFVVLMQSASLFSCYSINCHTSGSFFGTNGVSRSCFSYSIFPKRMALGEEKSRKGPYFLFFSRKRHVCTVSFLVVITGRMAYPGAVFRIVSFPKAQLWVKKKTTMTNFSCIFVQKACLHRSYLLFASQHHGLSLPYIFTIFRKKRC